jgi:hypothetical protein
LAIDATRQQGHGFCALLTEVGGGKTSAIGHADDYDEPDGQNFLTFFQAQERAKSVSRATSDGGILKPITVGEAAANYLEVLSVKNAQTAYDTKLRLEKHFLKKFSEKPVTNLTKTMLDNWFGVVGGQV